MCGKFEPQRHGLAIFIKETRIHCYIQNIEAGGLVALGKTIFLVSPISSLWKPMAFGEEPIWIPRAWFAGFI